MNLSATQKDRAAGVLLGQAIGDALGVPYEFKQPIAAGGARMVGGGLGLTGLASGPTTRRWRSASPRSPRPAQT